ncbi:ORF6N domain-containing protein [Parabacteroides pacaensis]|uniref:ORF6N domain-containing protein n=1 Tax=Parabacteroides pacaensis TaxID=2086575 RepID=UPI000D0EC99D|nr:ORF6N domain-containing protein [Parabacteroides pacaensis]
MEQLQLIQNKIYEIRGQKVMLDYDLAELYQVETRVLNQSVKRNINRFPEDFMFQLSKDEWDNMSSQIVMTSRSKRPKTALPLAFTEHGVVMLSSVLRSDIAIQTSVLVVRAFVAIRQLIANPPIDRVDQLETQMKELKDYIEDVFADYNDINDDTRMQLELINQTLAELQAQNKLQTKPRNPVGFIKPNN